MADFNKPVTTDTYTDHFGSIRDKDTSLVKMLDGTTDANLPTGAKRKNSGQKYRLEEWNGTSWNMVEPGLGDLTQAEVDQLAGIGSTTISGTQWGYLGGLGSAPLEDNDLAANGGSVPEVDRNATITGNRKFKSAVTKVGSGFSVIGIESDSDAISGGPYEWWIRSAFESLDFMERFSGNNHVPMTMGTDGVAMSGHARLALGSLNGDLYNDSNPVLDTTDLASNGGTVPEVDRINTFTESQEIATFRADALTIKSTDDTGISIGTVRDSNDNLVGFSKASGLDGAGAGYLQIDYDDGVTTGGYTPQGPGTLNGRLYDSGNRVYSASNAPAFSDVSGSIADGQVPSTAVRQYVDASTDLTDHESQVVELGGDFDAGEEVRCERIGNWVTITSLGRLTHTNTATPVSSSGVIPASFRPSGTISNVYRLGETRINSITTTTSGLFNLYYADFSGTGSASTSSGTVVSITYLIT